MMTLRLSEQDNQTLKCPECRASIFTATTKTGCEHVQYIKKMNPPGYADVLFFGCLSDGDQEKERQRERAYYQSFDGWSDRNRNNNYDDYEEWYDANGNDRDFIIDDDDIECKSYFTIIDLAGKRWELCFTPESMVNSDFEVDSEW